VIVFLVIFRVMSNKNTRVACLVACFIVAGMVFVALPKEDDTQVLGGRLARLIRWRPWNKPSTGQKEAAASMTPAQKWYNDPEELYKLNEVVPMESVFSGSELAKRAKSTYRDASGTIKRMNVDGALVCVLFTRKGSLRGGEMYKTAETNAVLSGSVEVTTLSFDSSPQGEESVVVYGPSTVFVIPPNTPHLLRFFEDTTITQRWEGSSDVEVYYYTPYLAQVEESAGRRDGS